MTLNIRIRGSRGQMWHVHGQQYGLEGVYLSQDQVDGFFEAPIRQAWDSAARQIGGSFKGMWRDVRDVALGFIVKPIGNKTVAQVEDAFRQSFTYRLDQWDHNAVLARIEVEDTAAVETRYLDVQQYQEADFNPGTDFYVTEAATPIIKLRAGQPNYYLPSVVTSWSTSGASGSGTLPVENPSPIPMYAKYVLTRGTWTLGDVSWEGPPGARVKGVDKLTGRDDRARTILLPTIGSAQGGATVDLESLIGNALMIRDASNQNLLGQMPVPGEYFTHEFPSYLQTGATVPVSVTGAPAGGAMVQCIQPRWFERPVGGRLLAP